ncbi:hypothetical protein ACWIID_40960 [Streptomyces phaeochromogenes]
MARAAVRRQGEGLSVAQVADKVAEAERRERETRQQLDSPAADRGPHDGDPQDLAEQWVARHAEWRRTAALMDGQDWPVYSPSTPRNGTSRAVRGHGSATHSGTPSLRAAWQMERQDARDELEAQLWLSADASRRLHAIAARTGLGPEQALAQLANRVRAAAGLTLTAQYGLEGAAWLTGDISSWLDNHGQRELVLRAMRHTESAPSLLGVSGHLLTAGAKR